MRQIGLDWVCGFGALCAVVGAWPVLGAGPVALPDPLEADKNPPEDLTDLLQEVPPKTAVKSPSKPKPLAPGETTTVTGAYQVAWLTLENGLPGGKDFGPGALSLFLGLRDGKCVQAWSATGKIRFNWFDRIELKLEGGSLKGELEGRARGRPSVLQGDFKYALDARVEGDKVSGSFTGTFGGTALSGKVSGTLRGETEMAKDNVIALNWTSYLGNEGTASAPPSKWKLVDSLDQARPVWKSEYYTPTGWGSGPDGRYADASYIEGVNGGASTPVVWDKKVYLYHYYPNPDLVKEVKVDFENNKWVRKTDHPVEIENLKKFGAALADDFVLCLDSATGKTLWRAMFPKRLQNVQTHKYRAANPTPWIEGGRIYVQNYAAGVYCLDAQTGKIIWEHRHPGSQGGFSTCVDSPNMTVAEGVVVVGLRGVLKGLDAATGKLLWQSGWGFNAPVKWTAGERSYVISAGKCLDPKTGRRIWAAPAQDIVYPRVIGNYLLSINNDAYDPGKAKGPPLLRCFEMGATNATQKWSARITPVGTGEATMAIAKGHVYFGGVELVCVKLDTGEVTARQPKAQCYLNPTMCYSDGRVILFPENHHGKMYLHMVDANPKTLNVLTTAWWAPHPTTTAYANMGIGILLVDGRLIARGQDGIYCYDLRDPRALAGEVCIPVFACSDPAPVRGGEVQLTWRTLHADKVRIEPEIGVEVKTAGAATVTVSDSVRYTLTATGKGGPVSHALDIEIRAQLFEFAASTNELIRGRPATLSWRTLNADAVRIEPGPGAVPANGTTTVTPEKTTRYVLTVEGPRGPATNAVEVAVVVPLEPVTPGGVKQGLAVAYYAYDGDGTLPDFEKLKPLGRGTESRLEFVSAASEARRVRTPTLDVVSLDGEDDAFAEAAVDAGFAGSRRVEKVAALFRGYLKVPADGFYEFALSSTDGSALFIGDTRVVDNNGRHPGAGEKSGRAYLRAGYHPLRVAYCLGRGSYDFRVRWRRWGAGKGREIVPGSALFHR